jgi:hypothetical protein
MNNGRSGNPSTNVIVNEGPRNESYFELVWRRFRRSKASIVGGIMVLILLPE